MRWRISALCASWWGASLTRQRSMHYRYTPQRPRHVPRAMHTVLALCGPAGSPPLRYPLSACSARAGIPARLQRTQPDHRRQPNSLHHLQRAHRARGRPRRVSHTISIRGGVRCDFPLWLCLARAFDNTRTVREGCSPRHPCVGFVPTGN
ncbi:hypothetical protein B0H19DRAFT_418043 [Mycena capillaripes]|nr:hypothetical protein B0H19DRAFT_418043 [Mycena capillaripes]